MFCRYAVSDPSNTSRENSRCVCGLGWQILTLNGANEWSCASERPSGRETLMAGELSVMVVIVAMGRLVKLVKFMMRDDELRRLGVWKKREGRNVFPARI